MTKDDIIELARNSGGVDISSHGWTSWVGTQSTEFLERFAKRVVALAAERERAECAKLCLETEPFYGVMFAAAIRARGNK